jgi:hypothetical protein
VPANWYDETLTEMGTPTQAAAPSGAPAGIYKWEIPGKPVSVHLDLDVIDSVLPEVMRAFGAVPKRGAEAGGLLIGNISRDPAGQSTVHVEQVELVPCVYARGPSYLLTGEDKIAFEQAVERWRLDASQPRYAVGYFRSHTRDGLALSAEDVELLDRLFPDPAQIALLVRPFAAKPIQAGFFFREKGSFPPETPLPFAFSRRELVEDVVAIPLPAPSRPVEPPPPEPPVAARPPEPVAESRTELRPYQGSPRRIIPLPDDPRYASPEPLPLPSAAKGSRARGWIWVPLSFALLAIGAVFGLEAPGYVNLNGYLNLSSLTSHTAEFALGLAVSQSGDSLTVRWNPDAPAIRRAQSGTLEIEDGGYSKPVDLDSTHLQNGSIIYRNTSPSVRFRLVVSEGARVSVTETTDWPR